MKITHTDLSTGKSEVLEVSEAHGNWIMKINEDGSSIENADQLKQAHRRYLDENREID